MPSSVRVAAPAKLNLALSVGPPNADRMHPISSWMVTVDLFDDLDVARLPDGSLSRYAIEWHPEARRRTPIDWSISKDLAVRAHLAIERLVGRPLPLQLHLRKRIPVGGGLGGGSSDAAAMIRAVDAIFELGLDRDAVHAIASGLGSDIPFLLEGGSAIVEGVGDRIERFERLPNLHAVLALPEIACPTGPIYHRFDRLPNPRLDPERVRLMLATDLEPHGPFNDLAEAAFLEAAGLREVHEALSQIAERPAHVSGSGSTLFVLCDDPLHAQALATAAEDRLGTPTVFVAAASPPAVEPTD